MDLARTVPGLKLDLRYTTDNNLFGAPLVLSSQVLLDRNAAQALARVQTGLKPYGYGLVVWEAYRSWRDFKLATLAWAKSMPICCPRRKKGIPTIPAEPRCEPVQPGNRGRGAHDLGF